MVPPRTSKVFARQQAGTLVKDAKCGLLVRDEIQLVRFIALVEHIFNLSSHEREDWSTRHDDLVEAAELAGLELGDHGWSKPDGMLAAYSEWGHLTVAEDVMRKGRVYASAWLYDTVGSRSEWAKSLTLQLRGRAHLERLDGFHLGLVVVPHARR